MQIFMTAWAFLVTLRSNILLEYKLVKILFNLLSACSLEDEPHQKKYTSDLKTFSLPLPSGQSIKWAHKISHPGRWIPGRTLLISLTLWLFLHHHPLGKPFWLDVSRDVLAIGKFGTIPEQPVQSRPVRSRPVLADLYKFQDKF